MRKSPISARSNRSIAAQDAGWSPSTSMRLAGRIAAGPNRAPGRFEVPRSNGIPATQIAASALVRSTPRKLGRMAYVGTVLITSIYGLRHPHITARRPFRERAPLFLLFLQEIISDRPRLHRRNP